MRALVHIEVSPLRESLATALEVAHVRPLAGMRALVHIEVSPLRESLATALEVAHVRPLAGMRALVRDEVPALREGRVAALEVAHVGLLAERQGRCCTRRMHCSPQTRLVPSRILNYKKMKGTRHQEENIVFVKRMCCIK